jgi:hypothetical protein
MLNWKMPDGVKRTPLVDSLFAYLPPECPGNIIRTEDSARFSHCLKRIANDEFASFDCSTVSELVYESDEPWAQGNKKFVYGGLFRGEKVVVKRPRTSLVHGVTDFRSEALMLTVLRSPHVARLLGQCSDPLMNVVERLRPLHVVIRDESLLWPTKS